MRTIFHILLFVIPFSLGWWAYKQNHQTLFVLDELDSFQSQIRETREIIRVYSAEWAYLNRPERLRELVNINYERLQLEPIRATNFGDISQIAFSSAFSSADASSYGARIEARSEDNVNE